MEIKTADLFSQRLKAAFREQPELLTAWGVAVLHAHQVQQELLKMGWNEADRTRAAHELCRALMNCAPWGAE